MFFKLNWTKEDLNMYEFKVNRVPVKISPCYIKDTAAEIRFNTALVPAEVLIGMLYTELKKDYPNAKIPPERLPINDIPASVRSLDVNLKYQPHYVIEIEPKIFVRIALNSISIGNLGDYVGWVKYSAYVKAVFNIIDKLKIINNIERLGLRYSSFFENEIKVFQKLNFSLMVANNDFIDAQNYLRSEWKYNDSIICVMQLSNNVMLNENNKAPSAGSLVDIDVANTVSDVDFSSVEILLEELHKVEKSIFFSLLKPQFLDSLSPEYENG
jgi:uncharacterized protein (TIGR04255 family)